jgi:hypothetical protein
VTPPLDEFEDLQAALGDLAVQCGQSDRRVVETLEVLPYRLQFLHRVAERVFPPHVTPWLLRAMRPLVSPHKDIV